MRYYGHDKYVAGAGTTTVAGIGAGLGGLAVLGNMANGNGFLGLGGGNNVNKENAELQAKVAKLEAERYTDNKLDVFAKENVDQLKEFFGRFEAVAEKAATTSAELKCLNQKLETYELSQREIRELEKQLAEKDKEILNNRINCLEGQVIAGNQAALGRFAELEAQIAGFTKTVIVKSAICDTTKMCGQQQ